MLDRSVKHNDYCAIGGQFHVDPFQLGGDPAEKGRIFLEGTLEYANQLDVPIISAQEWLDFTDLRHDTNFTDLVWDSNASTLIFNLLPLNQPDSTLTVLIPSQYADKVLSSVTVDGVTTSTSGRLVLGGMEYAHIIVSAQEHTVKATFS